MDPIFESSIYHAPELECEKESAPAYKIAHDGETYFSDESDGGWPRMAKETKENPGKGTPIFNPEEEPKKALSTLLSLKQGPLWRMDLSRGQ